jgi:F-type H+-transporting ATPase subunit a
MHSANLWPNLLAAGGGGESHTLGWYIFFYVGIVAVVTLGVLWYARQGLTRKVFRNPFTQAAEQLYLFLEQMVVGVIGPHGRRYLPLIASFWIFIFVSNFLGLFLPHTPTADWSINLGLAIVAIVYVQYEGICTNGFFGHLKHFAGPKLPVALFGVTALLFVIEIVSEAAKLLSLSLRLYGNINGGHIVVMNLNALGELGPISLPLGGLLILIKLLTVIVQALVFTLLTSVYIALVTHHEEPEGHHHKESHLAAAA